MLLPGKHIAVLFAIFFCCAVLQAQQGSSVLPSLINAEPKNNDDSISDVDMLKKKLFIKIITSKNSVFVGEPVMVTYKFYASMLINDQPSVQKQPEFTGCSVKELDFDQGPDFENINNESYAIYTIRKVQLTPLQPGLLSMGKASVNNYIQLPNANDPFNTKKYSITIVNDEADIEAKELPQKNKPADFYGIAGVFTITSSLKTNEVPVGESGHLIIAIKGSGNFDAIVKPDVKWPADIEHFDGNDSQHINQHNFPVSGERIFDIPFIGRQEGSINIAPVRFSFFNTMSERYETISTDSMQLTFSKPVDRKEEFNEAADYDVTNRKYLWIVPAIALTVALIGLISYKRNARNAAKNLPATSSTSPPVFITPQPALRIRYRTDFSRYLAELEGINTNKEFFIKAKDILTKAVAERIDSMQHSEQVLLEELKQRTYNAPVCNKVAALYEAFNLNLYAPFETTADLQFYHNELKQVVEELQAAG